MPVPLSLSLSFSMSASMTRKVVCCRLGARSERVSSPFLTVARVVEARARPKIGFESSGALVAIFKIIQCCLTVQKTR